MTQKINVYCSAPTNIQRKQTKQEQTPIFKTQANRSKQANCLRNFPCVICFENSILYKFTDCIHKLACNKCLEIHLKKQILSNSIPSCFMEGCQAKMITHQKSSFSFFSENTKTKYFERLKVIQTLNTHKSSQKIFVIRPCQVVDCQGVVNPDLKECVLCKTYHCQKCNGIHSKKENCNKKTVQINFSEISNINRCPNCNYGFEPDGGCNKITCPMCELKFCVHCNVKWSFTHHTCGNRSIFEIPLFWCTQRCHLSKVIQQQKTSEIEIK